MMLIGSVIFIWLASWCPHKESIKDVKTIELETKRWKMANQYHSHYVLSLEIEKDLYEFSKGLEYGVSIQGENYAAPIR